MRHFCTALLPLLAGQRDSDPQLPQSLQGRYDGSLGGSGGANLDYQQFPELGGSKGDLSLDSPAAWPSGELPTPTGKESSPKPPFPPSPSSRAGKAPLQPSKEPLPLFLRLRGKADLLWGWVILLAR